ncbi:conserved hypothetical protein, partial [Ixodes scapularis]
LWVVAFARLFFPRRVTFARSISSLSPQQRRAARGSPPRRGGPSLRNPVPRRERAVAVAQPLPTTARPSERPPPPSPRCGTAELRAGREDDVRPPRHAAKHGALPRRRPRAVSTATPASGPCLDAREPPPTGLPEAARRRRLSGRRLPREPAPTPVRCL